MNNNLDNIYDIAEMTELIQAMTGEKSDAIIKHFIFVSHKQIQNYLNALDKEMIDDNGKGLFHLEVVQFAIYILENTKQGNMVSKRQGERTVTFQQSIQIPQHIIKMLPLPYARSI